MKFSSMTAAGAVLGLAAATPITKRSSIHKRQVPQEQSHGFILNIANEFMKLENTLNIQDAVFGLLGNAAAEEGAGDVTNLDCLKQATADQAFTNAKAAGDIRGMAGALMFQAIERNTGSVGLASVLCDEPTVNPEVGALISHQDAASDNALAINKAITLELARQLATFGADPNLALLTGTFPPGDVNDNTGAGLTCDDVDLELGCIYTQKLLVLDATEDEIASAVSGIEQTFTGTGGISATDLVNLADFDVANVADEFDLSQLAPGSNGASATGNAGATATETPGAVVETPAATTATPAATDECELVASTTASTTDATADAEATGQCSLVTVTVGADQTSAIMAQYPSAVMSDVATPGENTDVASATENTDVASATENTAVASATETGAADDNNQGGNAGNNEQNQGGNDNDGAAAGGNLQTFAGDLGGAAPAVQNSGNADRPFEVNGATFTNEAAALVRSCDIQNNQCFNAVNRGDLAGGTQQCSQQLDECRANAGSAQRKTRRNQVLGGVDAALLRGSRVVGTSANRVAGGRGQAVKVVGVGGAQGLNLGSFLNGGNLAQLLGGGIVGAAGANQGQVVRASAGNQQLVAVVLQQCR